MKSNIAKTILAGAAFITAATVINKMLKETNFDDLLKNVTIDLDAFLPREEKIINPNGEDFTVKPEYVRIDEIQNSPNEPSDVKRHRSQSV